VALSGGDEAARDADVVLNGGCVSFILPFECSCCEAFGTLTALSTGDENWWCCWGGVSGCAEDADAKRLCQADRGAGTSRKSVYSSFVLFAPRSVCSIVSLLGRGDSSLSELVRPIVVNFVIVLVGLLLTVPG
jgi:hypothetical protein